MFRMLNNRDGNDEMFDLSYLHHPDILDFYNALEGFCTDWTMGHELLPACVRFDLIGKCELSDPLHGNAISGQICLTMDDWD